MTPADITNIIVALTALVTAINTLVSALHGKVLTQHTAAIKSIQDGTTPT